MVKEFKAGLEKGGTTRGSRTQGSRLWAGSRLFRHRKGIEVWISWVLLMGFIAVISFMMYDFMTDYSKDVSSDLKRISTNTKECGLVAISIDSACKQNSSSPIYLNITLTNRLNINVDELMYRTFNSGNAFLNVSSLNVSTSVLTLKPQQSMKLTINISDADLDTIQVVPVVYNEDNTIICNNKIVEMRGISEC